MTRAKQLISWALALFSVLCAAQALASSDESSSAAQWVTLGTSGGPIIHAERSQIANALVVNGAVYLFDIGDGARRQLALAGIPESGLKAIFISHHHIDHNADLGPLIVSHWTFGSGVLPVIGPEGTVHLVNGLADANAPTVLAGFPTAGRSKPPLAETVKPTDLPYHLQNPTKVYEDANIKVWAIGVDHFQVAPSVTLPRMPDAVAYRIEAGGRTFVYTGDTGPSARLINLAKGADVLVSEVVDVPAIVAQLTGTIKDVPPQVRASIGNGMSSNHLVPAEIGKVAVAAGVKEVVLTHFVPSPEVAADMADYVRDIAKVFRGPVLMAHDLDRF